MIIRILGEGQYEVPDEVIDDLNALDNQLLTEVEFGDGKEFGAMLGELLAGVRRLGTPLPADALVGSERVLPGEDADFDQLRELMSDEGFIPG